MPRAVDAAPGLLYVVDLIVPDVRHDNIFLSSALAERIKTSVNPFLFGSMRWKAIDVTKTLSSNPSPAQMPSRRCLSVPKALSSFFRLLALSQWITHTSTGISGTSALVRQCLCAFCPSVVGGTHGTVKWIACGGFRRTTGLLVAFTGMIRCVLPCVCCYRQLPVRLMRCPHGVDLVVHVQGNVIIRVVAKPLNVDVESLLELVKALDDRRVSWLLLRCCHSVVPFSTICAGSSCAGHLR